MCPSLATAIPHWLKLRLLVLQWITVQDLTDFSFWIDYPRKTIVLTYYIHHCCTLLIYIRGIAIQEEKEQERVVPGWYYPPLLYLEQRGDRKAVCMWLSACAGWAAGAVHVHGGDSGRGGKRTGGVVPHGYYPPLLTLEWRGGSEEVCACCWGCAQFGCH